MQMSEARVCQARGTVSANILRRELCQAGTRTSKEASEAGVECAWTMQLGGEIREEMGHQDTG